MSTTKSYMDVFLSPSTQHYISNNTMVGVLWQRAWAFFWNPNFWLYPGMKWEDLEHLDFNYPSFYDIWVYPLLLSVVFLVFVYFVFEPYVMNRLAQWAKIPNKRRRPPQPSKILEALFLRSGKKLFENELKKAARNTDMTVRQVERWLRHRHAVTRSTAYEKFLDQGFNFFHHMIMTIMSSCIMFSKPWLWEISLCWEDYPHHSIHDDVWWYYVVALTIFWAATFRQMLIPGRSTFDNVQYMIHHTLTIMLMVFSWTSNFVRIGTLVLLVHEFVDPPLSSAKMLVQIGVKGPADVLFGVFVLTWIITRTYLYLFWIMNSVFFYSSDILYVIPAGYLFKVLLTGLLIINVVWTFLILKVIAKKWTGGVLQDVRSDSEEFSDIAETANGRKKEN